MDDLKWLTNARLLTLLLALLFVVAGLYMADMMGWPNFQSSRLARVYTGLLGLLMVTVVPACMLGLTIIFLVLGFYW